MSHSRLSDPEYRNWITVGRAIQITRNGLESIIQNAVDNYHTSLLATLPSNIHAWKSHLATAHRSTDKRKICWSNSDNTQWLTAGASWEIAKIFMAPLGPRKLDVVNAKTTDISGLLNVLEWSPRGTNGIFNAGVSLLKLADVRGARNLWAHAPLLHTTNADKANAFAFFTSLLQDPELQHDKDVQHAINALSNLLKTGLVVIEENELEILVQLQRQLGQDMVCLGNDINCWKEQVDATLEQVKNHRESLKEFVKKNELQGVLETVQKKISDFEDQVVHELQSTNSRLDKLEENASAESQQFFYDDRSELKFNPVCDRMKEEFVGREWLFTTINSWLEKDLGPRESRAFLIWGGPGTGKSSFAQELVRRHENTLVGYHHCQKDNPRTCDLESLVYNLSRMLSKSLSEYAALIAELERTADKFRDQPDKLFDLLITTPLQQLKESTKHFLVIDGMDEGGHEIASCFARLSGTLPSWLRVILTARHNAPALSNLFPDSDVASLDHFITSLKSLFANQRNIDDDIREFVSMKYRTLLSEYNYIPSFFENEREGTEKIVKASQNCFLYAKLVMEHIFAGHDEIGLPASLSEVYCLDFKRRFPDIEYFEKKVAPVLEIVLAIQRANAFVHKDVLIMNDPLVTSRPDRLKGYKLLFGILIEGFEEGEEFVNGVVESGFRPGIRVRDLNKGLKLLSGYLVRDFFGKYYFTHSSVRDWLQDEKSDFFCDTRNGHSIMAAYNLKILKDKVPSQEDFVQDELNFFDPAFAKYCSKLSYSTALSNLKSFFIRYLFHSRYLPEPGSANVNVLITELGTEAIDLLHVAFDRMDDSPLLPFVRSENMAIKVLNETDVLNKMSSKEKAEHLELAIKSNCARIIAKFFGSARWIFSSEVLLAMTEEDIMEKCLQFVHKNGSLPQLFYSYMCSDILGLYFNVIVPFCQKHGAVLDVCFPKFCKNTKGFDSSTCWNEDVQEYFRKLKSGEKNVITLESLKEMPFYPEEARVSEFTLEIIQKPLSGSDCRFPCRFTW